ncbi:uncharacterized protein TNCV_2029671 [Trichonephila clavipes]|nr:uncharacterized protein TNCV_2029671 [Trichonephila clavipes]
MSISPTFILSPKVALNCDNRHCFCVFHSTKGLLWFGGRHVDNFVHTGKVDISKLGTFQDNFLHSLHTGYLEKNKEKWFFCRSMSSVGASMEYRLDICRVTKGAQFKV